MQERHVDRKVQSETVTEKHTDTETQTEEGRETDTTDRTLRRGPDGRGRSLERFPEARPLGRQRAWKFGAGVEGACSGRVFGVSWVWFATGRVLGPAPDLASLAG